MSAGLPASLKRRLDATAVVSSLVRRLKTVEIKTLKGSFEDSATSVTIGTSHLGVSFVKILTILWI